MKRIKTYVSVIMILIVIIGCQKEKEKVATLDYPRLKTLPVTGLSQSGVEFNAEIISGDVSQINECGFVGDAKKLVINEGVKNNRFSGKANFTLIKGVNYTVYSYVKTDKYMVYGNKVIFKFE
jgi:hypothetical protein